MPKKGLDSGFLATGIGSVPYSHVQDACTEILQNLPEIPYWPQLVKRSHLEDMNIQQSWHLPLLEVDAERRSLHVDGSRNTEAELLNFYEHYLQEDIKYFAIPPDYAPGLYRMVEMVRETSSPSEGAYIKGQSAGPLTFGAAVTGPDGKAVLHDPELMEAMVAGLSIKALWQVKKLEESGRRVILFFDEPYLSGFGSAFSPVGREEVIRYLQQVFQYLRERAEVLLGIHCCGNTDWAMLLEAGPDIINFDAHDYLGFFLLYKKEIISFLETGGIVAWGIVPTSSFKGEENSHLLFEKLFNGLQTIIEWGISPQDLYAQSMLTPACGMGTMAPDQAAKVHVLLADLSHMCRHRLL